MFLIRPEADRTGIPSPSGILAALAVSTQVTVVIGPTLGGILIGIGGWRTIFFVNVPLALASLALGWRRGVGSAATSAQADSSLSPPWTTRTTGPDPSSA